MGSDAEDTSENGRGMQSSVIVTVSKEEYTSSILSTTEAWNWCCTPRMFRKGQLTHDWWKNQAHVMNWSAAGLTGEQRFSCLLQSTDGEIQGDAKGRANCLHWCREDHNRGFGGVSGSGLCRKSMSVYEDEREEAVGPTGMPGKGINILGPGPIHGVSTESLPAWLGYGYYVRLWHQRTTVYCLHTKPWTEEEMEHISYRAMQREGSLADDRGLEAEVNNSVQSALRRHAGQTQAR